MTRYHKTPEGNIPFTEAEETARDISEKKWSDEAPLREMQEIRIFRNHLLKETDWAGLNDVTMSNEMKTYRQALRDIPASNTVYKDVEWPDKPKE